MLHRRFFALHWITVKLHQENIGQIHLKPTWNSSLMTWNLILIYNSLNKKEWLTNLYLSRIQQFWLGGRYETFEGKKHLMQCIMRTHILANRGIWNILIPSALRAGGLGGFTFHDVPSRRFAPRSVCFEAPGCTVVKGSFSAWGACERRR